MLVFVTQSTSYVTNLVLSHEIVLFPPKNSLLYSIQNLFSKIMVPPFHFSLLFIYTLRLKGINCLFKIFTRELFSEGIGVAVRAHVQLAYVSWWRKILKQIRKKSKKIIDCYRHWRNRLGSYYKEFVRKGKILREKSPRSEMTNTMWVKVCDWLESTKFKDRSLINSTNRSKLTYNYTLGKIRVLARYRKMASPSKVEIWRTTHVDKTGQFDKMIELEDKSMEEGEIPMSEDEILVEELGHRSGYQKGIRYGVEAAPRCKSFSSTTQQDSQVNEKLSETQNKVENAETKISTLTMEFEEQKERNKNTEEKI
ncbi:hypothetical protein ACJIZ3_008979 [Penstemon smallii]|uniref:Uncharacterized protein n=1 Tax=Penstemon smallii TaxID=265156 RepID=A0ABD3TDH3_9LAMI